MKKNTSSDKVIGVYKEDRDKYMGMENITVADTQPVLIPPAPSVLDDLGLQGIREEMDAEHNRMIRAKYALAVYMIAPSLIRPANREIEKSPFDSIYERETIPQPTTATHEEIQRAIDSMSIRDPQYRETAKKFLAEVIPQVNKEAQRLTAEVVKAEKELANVQKEYGDRVRKARAALDSFNKGIFKEYKKFETANSGSIVESGHTVTSSNCKPLVPGYKAPLYHYMMLQAINDAIDDYEAAMRPVDREIIKEMARNSRPPIARRSIREVARILFNMD